jgi:predicted dehydrogenase
VRLAIVGLGRAAEELHLPACAAVRGARLIAACEPDDDRRRSVERRFRIPELYEDAATLFTREKPDIAIIATPPDSHRDLCLLALDHGAHVLCEKPFVRSLEEADEVIAAAERHQRAVVVNNEYRYLPTYRRTQERIARGEFGSPYLIQCWQQMFHPPGLERNWRAALVQSTLFEFGTHPLDLIQFLFEAAPLSVTAHIPHPRPDITADVVAQVVLRFPGERLATMLFNRISHAPTRYLEMRVDCERASLRLSFGGVARAALDWSRLRGRPGLRLSMVRGGEARVEQGGRSRVVVREWTEGRPRATARVLQELMQSVASGSAGVEGARRAREVLRVVFAAYESARTGETVWLKKPG